MNILVLHGPNLNLLGEREPKVYGHTTLAQLNTQLRRTAKQLKVTLKIFQRNGEGDLIDLLHRHRRWADGILINPGAYTHTSYALHDALKAVQPPAMEVHLSDLRRREAWRRKSVTRPACCGQVAGKGVQSYLDGLRRLAQRLRRS
jgi:3-dehydroquinate dehydratase-2